VGGCVVTDLSAFRKDVVGFLDENLTVEIIERVYRSGTVHDWDLHRKFAAKGWINRSALEPEERQILTAELERRGAPTHAWNTAEMVAHILEIVGSEEHRKVVVPEVYEGEALICLGYSEPEVGSDIASVRTRARRDGDEWVISGQKMFTTMAHEATYVFLLTRTNPDVERHQGMTTFLVPMDTPGIEVVEIKTLGGERTNVTFYNDVRVADSCRVGEVDSGWEVMKVALAFERQSPASGEAARLIDLALSWGVASGALENPGVRRRLARLVLENEVSRLHDERVLRYSTEAGPPVAEASMAKLWTTEALQRCADGLMDIMGPQSVLSHGEPAAAAGGWIEHGHRSSQVYTIFGGTSEIQRSIIAQIRLGLPRAR
jgi:alkylation response protein AidB-like acyl-CoA dehydrogenase